MPAAARWVIPLLLVASAVALWSQSRGASGPGSGAQCLTHISCRADELCVVVPRGDGFATIGTCGAPCDEATVCPNGWSCATFVELGDHLVPPRDAPPGGGPRKLACAFQGPRTRR